MPQPSQPSQQHAPAATAPAGAGEAQPTTPAATQAGARSPAQSLAPPQTTPDTGLIPAQPVVSTPPPQAVTPIDGQPAVLIGTPPAALQPTTAHNGEITPAPQTQAPAAQEPVQQAAAQAGAQDVAPAQSPVAPVPVPAPAEHAAAPAQDVAPAQPLTGAGQLPDAGGEEQVPEPLMPAESIDSFLAKPLEELLAFIEHAPGTQEKERTALVTLLRGITGVSEDEDWLLLMKYIALHEMQLKFPTALIRTTRIFIQFNC